MEISNRQDIEKLIAYSKSIQVGLIEDDFNDQYTPPEKHVYESETLPDIKLEEFEPNLNEDEMLKLLKQNVQSAKMKESVSSEHDSLDSQDSIERRSTPPKLDPQIQIQIPVQKSQTTVDMTEYNKVPEEVLQLLDGAKERKSMLGAAIKNTKGTSMLLQSQGKPIKIYFFNTQQHIQLNVTKSTTVLQVIRISITEYYKNNNYDQRLLRYPDNVDAYEIRFVDDDYEFKAEMAFGAIDKKKEILSTQTNVFSLIEISNYKSQTNDMQILEKVNPNMILVDVLIIDQKPEKNVTTKIQLDKNSIVQDIFTQINKKNKQINQIDYIIQLNDDDTLLDLDLRMPVAQLQNKKVQIKQKTWADQAEQQFVNSQRRDTITEHDDYVDAPLNHIQAFKYEKFTVVKINERGKRQDRILGIDQFRIYNMNKKENLGLFERILNNKNSGTKFPQRLIEDIVDIRIAHQFLYITFRQENDFKELKFDTLDSKIAQKIYKKINFIRDFQITTQKYRASIQKLD
ncbi:unnamed protein product (macronuclear) [Paramecium tetraurelia]|uniref:SAPK-interacting protein 1 Pleckstrin-homology domain-containing protein n=1 Tax=Paramecium tetraurelia TaxID=5888 RepID=A0CKD5_PARTE|nr:uncharacterized protein GSPATT00000965001 [Paramecium tetraurelia]CAK71252.1 unnamed protein product [Paramecium tetraurelia]|eukprot:XP_001438649.1 hypothetical protein (macronuclear) [Paramecium tetraurelia strain d4-2]